ncbi:MAG: helix-turn-helix domain-containing protein [Candidatus Aenigmarchaeota archaeon]|nr:helix-turn-helix domain-containing protein [Candidatus Aenigmarchaeota archaeon]
MSEKKTNTSAVKLFNLLLDASIKNPEMTPDRVLIIELKSDIVEKIFTPARKEILELIKTKEPETVGEIAKLVNRPIESISRDMKILENYGLIELVQIGQTKKPKIEKDMLVITL